MAVIDRYLEAFRTPGAQCITFRSGAPVELLANGVPRAVSKGAPTAEQLRNILLEVLPPGFRFDPDGVARDFPYDGPAGRTRITVKITEAGIAVRALPWAAQPPSGPPEPMVIERTHHSSGSIPAVERAHTVPAMPAVQPAATPRHRSGTMPSVGGSHAPATPGVLLGKPAGIDELFTQMLDAHGSDLHLKSGARPMMRVHGEMTHMGRAPLTSAELWALIEPIIPERNREQYEKTHDTDFGYTFGTRSRMRCNVFSDIGGVGGVFRQIPNTILDAKELGLPPAALKLCDYPKGLVLVTGPTGSGKSTTLASMIDYINDSRHEHIITIEDPVEFVHRDKRCLVNQREVGSSTLTFQAALRAALREDPDVVLVGELRDLETTAIAIETAETGHLVFGTLHTNTAASTIDRLINQYPADRQAQVRAMLSESLLGVVSQALCRKRGGGRVGVYEVLIVTPAVSNLIREEKTFQIPTIMQTSRALGMQTMNDALFALARSGVIDAAEAYATSIAKKDMALMLTRANMRGVWSEEAAQ